MERAAYSRNLPFGFLLLSRNLSSAVQAAELTAELRSLGKPEPLLFVDQEGGTVDRLGPLLGFDADFAPCVDLGLRIPGEVVLASRTFGFHAEDVVVAGMVFLHRLTRAGIASCLKHFPGLGHGKVDSHTELPVVDAHDVDLMVTDVAPFTRPAFTSLAWDDLSAAVAAFNELLARPREIRVI